MRRAVVNVFVMSRVFLNIAFGFVIILLVGLRIKAERISGSKGVCEVDAQPVFTPAISQLAWLPGGREKSSDLFFTAVGFKLKMNPGDFILLGPQKYLRDKTTLGGVFFSGAGREAAVRTYLLVCADIVD